MLKLKTSKMIEYIIGVKPDSDTYYHFINLQKRVNDWCKKNNRPIA